MCGIAGIVGLGKNQETEMLIKSMTKAMSHRGPDADGHFVEPNIALGHRRLSIIDLNPESNQPFLDNSQRYSMVFNGEIYNYKSIKSEISDYNFKTNSDTEVVLAAYIKWGSSFLKKLNGMFALAIWDKEKSELFVARDRVGIKPFYFFQKENFFIFSSEIRSILSTGIVPKKLNKKAVVDYLNYQSVFSPLSIIENVFQLENGHYGLFKNGKFETNKFWDITDIESEDRDYSNEKRIQKEVEKLLLNSVERRMISDVPLGAFLSGGIDSSGIVALMSELTEKPIDTFSVVFDEKEYDESTYSELISKKYKTNHHPILLKPKRFLEELPNALNSMDTPSGDGANSYVVSKVTKKAGITVALSGLGGDELFAGYPVFKQIHNLSKYKTAWPVTKPFRKLGQLFLNLKESTHKTDRLNQLLQGNSVSVQEIYPIFRKLSSSNFLEGVFKNGLAKHNTLNEVFRGMDEKFKSLPLLSQVSVGEILGYTQNVLLKDTDQMSMASALEVRVPFFDHELIEYVLQIPDKFKYPKYSKSLLVESIAPRLPDEIVFRKKMGFTFPWKTWLKTDLKNFCEEKIESLAARNIFEGNYISNIWNRFLKDDKEIIWTNVWLLVVLENWLQTNGVD